MREDGVILQTPRASNDHRPDLEHPMEVLRCDMELRAIVAAAIAGYAIGQQAERSKISTASRQVAIMLLAVGVTYVIGRLVGVSIN